MRNKLRNGYLRVVFKIARLNSSKFWSFFSLLPYLGVNEEPISDEKSHFGQSWDFIYPLNVAAFEEGWESLFEIGSS